jgi:hypothetical protein
MKLILDLTPEEIAILQDAIERGELNGEGVQIVDARAIPEDDPSYEKYKRAIKQAIKKQQPTIEEDAKLPADAKATSVTNQPDDAVDSVEHQQRRKKGDEISLSDL